MRYEYEMLKESGMFWVFYPDLTGQWSIDEEAWKVIHDELLEIRKQQSLK